MDEKHKPIQLISFDQNKSMTYAYFRISRQPLSYSLAHKS
jgi:hypothetical protein